MDPSRVPAARAALALAALLALTLVPAARAAPLNDTGQITCYNATTSTGTVSPGTAVPADPGFEDQDCTRGAAAADALGLMSKQGASSMPGRDYTRISNAGNDLPASAARASLRASRALPRLHRVSIDAGSIACAAWSTLMASSTRPALSKATPCSRAGSTAVGNSTRTFAASSAARSGRPWPMRAAMWSSCSFTEDPRGTGRTR